MNTIYKYFFDEFGNDLVESIKKLSIGDLIEKLFGEQVSSMLDILDMFKSTKDNFSGNHSIEYSFITLFANIGFFMLSIAFPEFVIGFDTANNIIEQIFSNIDYGKILE